MARSNKSETGPIDIIALSNKLAQASNKNPEATPLDLFPAKIDNLTFRGKNVIAYLTVHAVRYTEGDSPVVQELWVNGSVVAEMKYPLGTIVPQERVVALQPFLQTGGNDIRIKGWTFSAGVFKHLLARFKMTVDGNVVVDKEYDAPLGTPNLYHVYDEHYPVHV